VRLRVYKPINQKCIAATAGACFSQTRAETSPSTFDSSRFETALKSAPETAEETQIAIFEESFWETAEATGQESFDRTGLETVEESAMGIAELTERATSTLCSHNLCLGITIFFLVYMKCLKGVLT
jgi:hypothetical protein